MVISKLQEKEIDNTISRLSPAEFEPHLHPQASPTHSSVSEWLRLSVLPIQTGGKPHPLLGNQ
jgi:hypothetical protein